MFCRFRRMSYLWGLVTCGNIKDYVINGLPCTNNYQENTTNNTKNKTTTKL